MLVDSSAVRETVGGKSSAKGWRNGQLTTGAKLIQFAPLKLESEMPSSKRCSALGFFYPQTGTRRFGFQARFWAISRPMLFEN